MFLLTQVVTVRESFHSQTRKLYIEDPILALRTQGEATVNFLCMPACFRRWCVECELLVIFPPGKGITRPQPLEMHCPKPSWWSPASEAVQFIWGYLPTAALVPRVQKNPVPILVTHEVQGEPQIDVDWLGPPIKASFLHNMGRTFSEICETARPVQVSSTNKLVWRATALVNN